MYDVELPQSILHYVGNTISSLVYNTLEGHPYFHKYVGSNEHTHASPYVNAPMSFQGASLSSLFRNIPNPEDHSQIFQNGYRYIFKNDYAVYWETEQIIIS